MDPGLLELKLLTMAIYERYGYDFRDYAIPSLQRRVADVVSVYRLQSCGELQHRILYDAHFFYDVLDRLTLTVSDFYRDPHVWKTIREELIPFFRTFHSLKFWSAGCSNGQEAYSLAILLHEENLLQRSIIHATDINPQALQQGRSGSFKVSTIDAGQQAYVDAGGGRALWEYFQRDGERAVIEGDLKKKVLFNHHNLATDSSFGEMTVILCRNALIYFQPTLREKALALLNDSLQVGGYLILGARESLALSSFEKLFGGEFRDARIYKKRDP